MSALARIRIWLRHSDAAYTESKSVISNTVISEIRGYAFAWVPGSSCDLFGARLNLPDSLALLLEATDY
jgi:hypothetical protein